MLNGAIWECTLDGGRDGVRGGSIPFFSNGGATPPTPYCHCLCSGIREIYLAPKSQFAGPEELIALRSTPYASQRCTNPGVTAGVV